MIYFAYDGSINGDWVARYAIHLASHTPDKKLRLLHADDGACTPERRAASLERIGYECAIAGVTLEPTILPLRGAVATTLTRAVQGQPDAVLLCGTRVRPGAKGFLAGTVSERLLRAAPCHVVALRVVHPGLLGAPHHLLLPVAGHPRGLRSAFPLLRLLAPDLQFVHVLRVMIASRRLLLRLRAHRSSRLRRLGLEYAGYVEKQLVQDAHVGPERIDTFVRISDDWARQIIIHASHYKSQLICVGATERSPAHRWLFGNPLEYLLHHAPCDVAVYRGAP